MAFVTTFVMLLSCLVVAPQKAQAASNTPTIKLLGATLRLDDTEDSQSLRIGIEISNASNVKNCGITLQTADGKSATVQTGPDGANNIYDYDEEQDKIIYTVALTGIKPENFDTGITVTGKAEPLSGGSWIDKTADTAKSVNSVVEVMKKQLGMDMQFDGAHLVATIATYDFENLTEHSNPEWINCAKLGPNEDAHSGNKSMEMHPIADYGGYVFDELPSAGEYTLSAYVKKASTENDVSVKFKSALGYQCKETLTLTDEWQVLKSTYVLGSSDTSLDATDQWNNTHKKMKISPTTASADKPAKYLIDDVVITKKLTADDVFGIKIAKNFKVELSEQNFCAMHPNNEISDVTYSNGVVSGKVNKQGYNGICFYLNADKSPVIASDYKAIKVTMTASNASQPICILPVTTSTNNYWGLKGFTGAPNDGALFADTSATAGADNVFTYDFTTRSYTQDIPIYSIKIQNNNGEPFDFTIKSIEFIAA